MADNIVLYGKLKGESRVSLTARIEWLPDGTIKPLMYWTPDGTCYQVTSHLECVRLAFLKEGGMGLRFKLRSKIIDTPDDCAELLHTRHEAYVYLTDKRFSEKNIIDGRYGHTGKEYISVTLDVFPDGDYELVCFKVHDERYMVEKTCDIAIRGAFKAGGVGIRHKVEARLVNAENDEDPDPQKSVRRVVALYWELNKWFVSIAKTA